MELRGTVNVELGPGALGESRVGLLTLDIPRLCDGKTLGNGGSNISVRNSSRFIKSFNKAVAAFENEYNKEMYNV